nr:Major intrinsic protein domain containing protein [Haemonchus contortus]
MTSQGVILLITGFIGLSVIMQLILSDEKINTWTQINFGWGLAIVFTVYLGAKTSGGHYNPAVSITMLTFGKLSFSHFIIYCIVQTAGAFVGAATAYLLYYVQTREESLRFETVAAPEKPSENVQARVSKETLRATVDE